MMRIQPAFAFDQKQSGLEITVDRDGSKAYVGVRSNGLMLQPASVSDPLQLLHQARLLIRAAEAMKDARATRHIPQFSINQERP